MEVSVEKCKQESLSDSMFDVAKVVALAIVIALFIRVFLFQPFNIPSGSMKATLLVGDYLIISKYSYGYNRYSFPFHIKLFNGRIFASQPKRGDVVVFQDKGITYIKRVVGLPGDRVQMHEGRLILNDKYVKRKKVAPYKMPGQDWDVRRFEETMPNGKSYQTLDLGHGKDGDNTRVFMVPEGHFFMMGDNRDNSLDSRFGKPIGFVSEENLIGKAQFIYFSKKYGKKKADTSHIRWQRLFTWVR